MDAFLGIFRQVVPFQERCHQLQLRETKLLDVALRFEPDFVQHGGQVGMVFEPEVFIEGQVAHGYYFLRDIAVPGEKQFRPDALVVQHHGHAAEGEVGEPGVGFIKQQPVAAAGIEKAVTEFMQDDLLLLAAVMRHPAGHLCQVGLFFGIEIAVMLQPVDGFSEIAGTVAAFQFRHFGDEGAECGMEGPVQEGALTLHCQRGQGFGIMQIEAESHAGKHEPQHENVGLFVVMLQQHFVAAVTWDVGGMAQGLAGIGVYPERFGGLAFREPYFIDDLEMWVMPVEEGFHFFGRFERRVGRFGVEPEGAGGGHDGGLLAEGRHFAFVMQRLHIVEKREYGRYNVVGGVWSVLEGGLQELPE